MKEKSFFSKYKTDLHIIFDFFIFLTHSEGICGKPYLTVGGKGVRDFQSEGHICVGTRANECARFYRIINMNASRSESEYKTRK